MLVRGVIGDEAEHDLQAEPVCLGQQFVQIGQCSEHRIDLGVVTNAVAESAIGDR